MLVFVIDALFVNVYDERQNKVIKKETCVAVRKRRNQNVLPVRKILMFNLRRSSGVAEDP